MRSVLLLLTMIVVTVGAARADSVTYTVSAKSGLFSYDFTLTNTGQTGGTLYDLFLSIPLDIDLIDTATIGTPVGWGDPTGGLLFFGPNGSPRSSFIEWADDASGLYDIGIGDSLAGFSFVSSKAVSGPIEFALNGSTTLGTAQPVSNVPESSTVPLFLACLGFLTIERWAATHRRNPKSLPSGSSWIDQWKK